ncbi:hypothetical protein ACFYNM_29470 [Streptomyces spororaveus]|uniref:hypothetical protein n=1 Tax=Streptomyces spororaveus TaxID=284039 RepID=UPI0036B5FC4F
MGQPGIRTARTARIGGFAMCLALAAAGCSSPDSGPKKTAPESATTSVTVEVADACPGLLSAAGAEALKRVLQSSAVMRDEAQAVGVAATGKALEAAYKAGPKVREAAVPSCTVTGQVGGGERMGEIRLTADSGKAGPPRPDQVGVRVLPGEKEAGVSFDCVSTRVGSTTDVPLRITGVFANRWQKLESDSGLADEYLVVAHSAALAVSRELGCANNGGLPAAAGELDR